MRNRPLSSSSIKTYLQCALKYYLHYEEEKPVVGKPDHLAFGTALHVALEYMHKVVSETKQEPSPEVYEAVISLFMKTGADEGLKDLALYNEGRDILISRLDAVDPEEKIIGLEIAFELTTPNGTPFRGSIDKLVELDETTAAVIDYKSSRMALTQDEIDIDVQLSMYDLAVSMLYPQYTTIVCALDYLRMGDVVTDRTPEERLAFTQFLDAVYANICSLKAEEVRPTLNPLCGWCDEKSFCPEFNKLVTDPELLLPLLSEMDDEKFVDAWRIFEAAKKIIESRYRDFKEDAYVRLENKESVKGKDMELSKSQQGRVYYDSKSIFNIVGQDDFVKIASVGKGGVDKYLRDNPDMAEDIEGAANFAFQAPVFRLRKLK